MERDKDGYDRGHCYACSFHGDVFDLIAQRDGVSLSEAMKRVREQNGANTVPPPTPRKAEQPETPRKSYAAYILACAAAMKGSEGEAYLLGRGFTRETIVRFCLGYDANIRSIVIPYDSACTYYLARNIDAKSTSERRFSKPPQDEAGSEPVYNVAALYQSDCVFVTESPLDAISIAQAGGDAVSIGGIGTRKLVEQLEKKPTTAALWIATDKDDAGERAADDLSAAIEGKGLCMDVARVLITGDYKDANEALQNAPAALAEAVTEYKELASKAQSAQAQQEAQQEADASAAYYAKRVAARRESFLANIERSRTKKVIPTGFPTLDDALGGGLRAGLYFLGGVSSLGKTSLVLQIADQIAESGRDVLFFSLEMSADELIAKSISRTTYEIAALGSRPMQQAKTTNGILDGDIPAQDRKLFAEAEQRYFATTGDRLWLVEGNGDTGIEQIRAAIDEHTRTRGTAPVVFVDYVQIIEPPRENMSDKQCVDKHVKGLKMISRDYQVPVVGISSFNRESYAAPVSMSAFKESGSMEYGCDVLIGLQLDGADKCGSDRDEQRKLREQNDEKAKNGGDIEIEAKILKSRNGTRETVKLQFCPRFNYFKDYFAPANRVAATPKQGETGGVIPWDRIARC